MSSTVETAALTSRTEIRRALDRVEFLEILTGKRRDQQLDTLIGESHLRTYRAGEPVVRQGEHGHTLFVILRGSVRVETLIDGESRTVETLESSRDRTVWFGEGAVLGRTVRPSTVVAATDALLLEIEKVRLEKLDNVASGVIDKLLALSERRNIRDFLTQHRAFSALLPVETALLVEHGRIGTADRLETVFTEGSPARSVLVIKSGVAKLERKGKGGKSVLAYFNAGDVVGLRDSGARPGSLVAMGFLEYIEVPKAQFDIVVSRADGRVDMGRGDRRWSDQLNKALNTQQKPLVAELSNKTGMIFVDEFMQEGAQIAQSLLTIDLDLCTRCGNCVVACESRHGHAKMTRRGKRLERRRDAEEEAHQPLLLPSSCRHCESPECMIGCPTGAIHRKLTGEVAIHEFCIGCSNCALRCPWDNITMVETPDRWVLDRVTGKNLATPKIASKCDLCAGFDEANCVHNCPTKAIIRVEPSYFPEVREMLGEQAAHAADARTQTDDDTPDRSRLVLLALTLAASLVLTLIYGSADVYRTYSVQGVTLGVSALTFMTLASALFARRRLRRYPQKPPHPDKPADPSKAWRTQLGPMYLWARAHVWFGVLAMVATALHANFHLGGVITSLLVLLLFLQVTTGLFGLAFSKWMPKVVTRLERDSQVEEDVASEREQIAERRTELLKDAPPEVLAVAAKTSWAVGTRLSRFAQDYDGDRSQKELIMALGPLMKPLDRKFTSMIEKLAEDAVRLEEIKALLSLYQLRRAWLSMHLTVTAMLLVFILVHVGSVAFFFLRLG